MESVLKVYLLHLLIFFIEHNSEKWTTKKTINLTKHEHLIYFNDYVRTKSQLFANAASVIVNICMDGVSVQVCVR